MNKNQLKSLLENIYVLLAEDDKPGNPPTGRSTSGSGSGSGVPMVPDILRVISRHLNRSRNNNK